MSSGCTLDGCTVGETGACALERDPATCDRRIGAPGQPVVGGTEAETSVPDIGEIGAPVLVRPTGSASFPSSHTLGMDVVSRMMAKRYVTVVGILGDPNSGKTACLASLYLLVSNAMLDGWSFADSRSLMGFEDIARGARDWNTGNPPGQMTVHTELADDRQAGFLHLRLVRKSDGRRVDLALPDLPGEWTTELVANVQAADRFEFMKAAEVIWIVLDGRALADRERRQALISKTVQLAERLKRMFDGRLPRIIFVVTHRDDGAMAQAVAERLTSELAKRDVVASIVEVAPFSDHPPVRAGFGISDLISETAGGPRPVKEFWPARPTRPDARSFVAHRRDQ